MPKRRTWLALLMGLVFVVGPIVLAGCHFHRNHAGTDYYEQDELGDEYRYGNSHS